MHVVQKVAIRTPDGLVYCSRHGGQCSVVIVTFSSISVNLKKEVAGRDAGDARVETRGFIVSVDKLKLKYLICTN